jgi:type VI secretion system secreted protein Hcp
MARSDMFLKIEGAKQGPIKGESQDPAHRDEIDVVSWSWGMQSHTSLQSGLPAGKTSIDALTVTKHADKASTAIMSSLRNNEVIKKATLTVRKAGETALEYMKITLQQARIVSYSTSAQSADGGPEVTEQVSLAFKKMTVEYTPQGADGQALGATMFDTEV